MDMYKLKFTRLQNEIFRFLCIKTGKSLNQRAIAKSLKVSPTAISKSLMSLKKYNIIEINKEENINLTNIELNRNNEKVIELKRTENLKMIYESGLSNFLEEKFPGCAIILFGSYSFGEDSIESDIDIAIINGKEKTLELNKFEKLLEREIRINYYKDIKSIHKNLRSNILNGIVLSGRIIL
jgi:predicted nucleotidyltransferase